MATAAVNPRFAHLCRDPKLLLAFGFGSGLSPIAPGTMGTLCAIPIYLFLRELGPLAYTTVLVLSFTLGIVLCSAVSRQLEVHDHGGIVWDEMVGYWATMLFAPRDWWWLVLGFVLFRLFDILKPWPVSWADKKIAGGLGIMLDDLLAAAYALILLQSLVWFVNLMG